MNTTTSLAVNSNTTTAENVFSRDETFQYSSSGFNNDLTQTTMVISFANTIPVSRIALIGFNFQSFRIYRDGDTTSTLALTTGPTSASNWSSNSETSMYLSFTTIQAQTISIDILSTQVANSEKAIGYLYLADTRIVFPRIPSAPDYKPLHKAKQVIHRLSDGSSRIHEIDRKFSAKIKFKFIEESFRDNLFDVFKDQGEFGFVAFETATAWDQVFFPVIWPGNFDFFKFSENAPNSGFSGNIRIEEATS